MIYDSRASLASKAIMSGTIAWLSYELVLLPSVSDSVHHFAKWFFPTYSLFAAWWFVRFVIGPIGPDQE